MLAMARALSDPMVLSHRRKHNRYPNGSNDGQEAVSRVSSAPFDLYVLDLLEAEGFGPKILHLRATYG